MAKKRIKKRRKISPFGRSMFRFTLNKQKIPKIILGEAKKRKHIIYGARAMNIQLHGVLRRHTRDWDIYAKKPRATAQRIQKKLDKEVAMGKDDFYAKRAKYEKTYKVMHEGADEKQKTKDDFGIVDYTKMERGIKTVSIRGVLFERLTSIKKQKKKILKDPKSKYRHAKDRRDLRSIRGSKVLRRRR